MKQIPIKNNSGKIIIGYAKFIKALLIIMSVISSLPFFIGGYVIYASADSGFSLLLGVFLGFAVIVIGFQLAVIATSFISGYGEMIENSAEIASGISYLCAVNGGVMDDSASAESSGAVRNYEYTQADRVRNLEYVQADRVRTYSDAVHVENATGKPVPCPYCRTQVPFGSNFCPKCRKRFLFVRRNGTTASGN